MFTLDRRTLRGLARSTTLALALTAAVAGSGCKNSSTGAETDFGANNSEIIVALGDSITFGLGDTDILECSEDNRGAGGFCPVLQSLMGKFVINAGVCGETSSGGVDRIGDLLLFYHPSVILIDYSPNDVIFETNAVIDNLRLMISAARANQTVPVIGTLIPATGWNAGWNSGIVSLNAEILALCAEEDLECADHYQAFVNDRGFQESPDALMAPDGLHPNHEGYALMAKTWQRALRRVY